MIHEPGSVPASSITFLNANAPLCTRISRSANRTFGRGTEGTAAHPKREESKMAMMSRSFILLAHGGSNRRHRSHDSLHRLGFSVAWRQYPVDETTLMGICHR